MSIPNSLEKPNFGLNEGVWEYKTFDGDILCYVVRYQIHGKKSFKPYTVQEGKWLAKWFVNKDGDTLKDRPLYGLDKLKNYPDRKILLVEGEKTADAGQELFPEFNVLSWMGGAGMAKNVDLRHLKGKAVYLLPDNDKAGYKAMECLKDRLHGLASDVFIVDIGSLSIIPEKWDLADFNDGIVDLEDIKLLFQNTKKLDPLSYPELSEGKNPRPLDTTKNFKHLLDFYNISLKWNIMKRECEAFVPGEDFYYEEKDNEILTYLENLAINNNFRINRVGKHMDAIALKNRYHPIRDWILSKPLNKEGGLNDLISTIKTTDDSLSHLLLKRWMISAIAALFNEGDFVAQGVLVIQGITGWRKTTFISLLAPQEFKAIKKGSELDPSNKDNLIRLAKYWIAELGELGGTINKSDANKLKSHITLELDEARRPYAAKDSYMIRRTVYAGTVNEENFLVDDTGNRRWWTISLTEPIDTDKIKNMDMQQIWREAYELYIKGERAYLDDKELNRLNKSNEQYERIDPLCEKLDSHFDWNHPERIGMTATEVLSHIGYDKPDRSLTNRMASRLRKRNVKLLSRSVYLMPRSLFDKTKSM